jgi:hypothetical protein
MLQLQPRAIADSATKSVERRQRHRFYYYILKPYSMKKFTVIVAMIMIFGASISSCSAGAHVGTKKHQVSADTQVK